MIFPGSTVFSYSLGIIGRPNVGKSTFFNRLLGQKRALVYDAPGMTRDWQCYDLSIGGKQWAIYDTPGLEESQDFQNVFNSINDFLFSQGHQRSPLFDFLLWIVDGQKIPDGQDMELLHFLRKKGHSFCPHIILGLNKCENKKTQYKAIGEWSKFGFPFVSFSALHGDHMDSFHEYLMENIPETSQKDCPSTVMEETLEIPNDKTIALTIIGKPNVGKSSLTNVLLGCERMKTGPQAGLTRDSVTTPLKWTIEGQSYGIRLTDTAGIPKGAKMKHPSSEERQKDQEAMSHLAWKDMQRALCFSHVTLVVMDASVPISHQDLSLLKMAQEEKRCIIVVLNKWDLVKDPQEVFYNLPTFLDQYHLVPFSTKTSQGKEELQQCIVTRFDQWSQHIPTAPLNRWLSSTLTIHTPPLVNGRRIKIRYVTQTKTKPPTFEFFGSQVSLLPKCYESYLRKKLTEDFNIANPILRFKSTKNPFIKK